MQKFLLSVILSIDKTDINNKLRNNYMNNSIKALYLEVVFSL